MKPPKLDLKLTLKTSGPNTNTATTHNKHRAYTLSNGKLEHVYNDISKYMYALGKISKQTMQQITQEINEKR